MLKEIVQYMNQYLEVNAIEDYPNALNGLQLENDGTVTKIAAAVDANEFTINASIEQNADLLIAHHGIFWGGLVPVVDVSYRKLSKAIKSNLAIYSMHLPLDMHGEIGNNVLLAKALGFKNLKPFMFLKDKVLGVRAMGVRAQEEMTLDELMNRAEKVLNHRPWICRGGSEKIKNIGIVTGGAGTRINQAREEGVDTFLSGEGAHHVFGLAEELQMNLILAGHYATETFGVKALSKHIGEKYGLETIFIDHPSGL